ncbi:MAG: hypothetical protein IT376_03175 [Polyangiaceae bacterium]|nr:hypothetical protein [Polyangiaceae bacterium]
MSVLVGGAAVACAAGGDLDNAPRSSTGGGAGVDAGDGGDPDGSAGASGTGGSAASGGTGGSGGSAAGGGASGASGAAGSSGAGGAAGASGGGGTSGAAATGGQAGAAASGGSGGTGGGGSSCPAGYYDIDNNPLTGAQGCEYACTKTSDDDPIDPSFTDANCDGSDGVVEQCVYVSKAGSDLLGDGTRQSPKATIAGAIAFAQSNGVPAVCLSGETYEEAVTIVSGISLYGGFDQADADFEFRRKAGVTSTVRAAGTVIHAPQINAETHVEGMKIEATTPGSGKSTYGVRLASGLATLYVRYNVIEAGAGADGAAPNPPTAPDGGGGGDASGSAGVGTGGGGLNDSGGPGGPGGLGGGGGPGGAGGGGGGGPSACAAGKLGGITFQNNQCSTNAPGFGGFGGTSLASGSGGNGSNGVSGELVQVN